ncbi:MAG: mechanosensitive ion channel protein MscS, partial [Phototrophicales bacterium]
TVLRVPFRVILTVIFTYLGIRLSYAAIARFSGVIADTYVMTQTNRRLQLRINTISGVAKSIVTLIWFIVGIVAALALVGVNVTPLIAGAGVIGIALSLAAQNIIKDAINGFLIILEDQYAVGDVIGVGDLGGKVETINLRIT